MRVRNVIAVSLGALAGAGCGSSAARDFVCDATTPVGATMVHTCTEDTSVPVSSIDGLTADCANASGTSSAACSMEGLLGSCALPTDETSPYAATIYYYAGGGLTATAAELSCLAGDGAWSNGG